MLESHTRDLDRAKTGHLCHQGQPQEAPRWDVRGVWMSFYHVQDNLLICGQTGQSEAQISTVSVDMYNIQS